MFDFGLVSLPVLALSALFGYAVLFDVDSVVFHNIEVPASVEYQGYTSEVVASRLAQEVKRIKREAKTARQMSEFDLPDEDSPIQALGRYYDFLTPVIATQELLGLIRYSFFGNMVKTKSGLTLTVHGLQTTTGRSFETVVSGSDPEMLVKTAAIDATRFIDPYVVASYYYETTVESESKDFSKTLDELKNCVQALPDSDQHWVHNLWGLVLYQTGEYDKALAEFDDALKLNPGFVLSVHNIGRVQLARGEYEAAITTFKRVVEMDKANNYRTPHAYTQWGNALVALGRPDEAKGVYERAIKAGPEYPDAYASFGRLQASQGKLLEARVLYSIAVKLDPERRAFREALEALPR